MANRALRATPAKGKQKGEKNFSFFFLLLLWELGGGYRNTTIVQLEDSMGDFLSPKKKDVSDRLWWRIELYRRHHDGCHSRYELTVNGTWDQHREDIRLLRQRWLESKAKKATSKHPKSPKDPPQETRTQLLSLQQRPSKKKKYEISMCKTAGAYNSQTPHRIGAIIRHLFSPSKESTETVEEKKIRNTRESI